jgi:antirestriction protein ArdC
MTLVVVSEHGHVTVSRIEGNGVGARPRRETATIGVIANLGGERDQRPFHGVALEGLPERFFPAPTATDILPIADHEGWFAKLNIKRILTQDIACYIPSKDVIGMPPLAAFDSPEHYAATLNHEAVHATGAAHRVDRDMGKRFSTHALAAEELVAEIGASILGAHLGPPPGHLSDHASYVGHWMKLLKDDKRAFLSAAAQAQTAVDWLLDKAGTRNASPPHQNDEVDSLTCAV